ncbi:MULTISPECIES: rhodanese-like domain-containing protein [unclassified Gilliamella]|uniref:rhodanese-like domain-containing protein n=1 Tax=unclassified Gilliamella TaxID=2685620 RepID=UPI001C6A37E8|nr:MULTISPECIES: rhodanese-like domain-containing protein [unclassified Gilliamella]MCX8602356.1 rhodanese-like domain-containing protein [Gilliamella sp. B3722]MCX8608529.1 rhodanese-like domain-containing protein [Gilliamella sp. B3771]MCX8610339.1 rhodanese-like domain-containing protein [Gilliamella sp. B3891]MCX8612993.1 rhodanese-like domain-containing protein [Gilliamella sp. B3773]MCX8616516.1 rhodanese-like domain-containing protein [Gilliamella sp. B3770]
MDFITLEIIPFIKNHLLLSLGWIVLFIAIIVLTVKSKLSKVKIINNAQAINMINKLDAVIIDIRSADSFKKGHITQSHNILPIDIKNANAKTIDKFKENLIILVDENGLSSSSIGELLVKQGFLNVFTLKDGIAGWNGENLPLVKK